MEGGASVEYDGGGGLAGLDTDWIWQEDVGALVASYGLIAFVLVQLVYRLYIYKAFMISVLAAWVLWLGSAIVLTGSISIDSMVDRGNAVQDASRGLLIGIKIFLVAWFELLMPFWSDLSFALKAIWDSLETTTKIIIVFGVLFIWGLVKAFLKARAAVASGADKLKRNADMLKSLGYQASFLLVGPAIWYTSDAVFSRTPVWVLPLAVRAMLSLGPVLQSVRAFQHCRKEPMTRAAKETGNLWLSYWACWPSVNFIGLFILSYAGDVFRMQIVLLVLLVWLQFWQGSKHIPDLVMKLYTYLGVPLWSVATANLPAWVQSPASFVYNNLSSITAAHAYASNNKLAAVLMGLFGLGLISTLIATVSGVLTLVVWWGASLRTTEVAAKKREHEYAAQLSFWVLALSSEAMTAVPVVGMFVGMWQPLVLMIAMMFGETVLARTIAIVGRLIGDRAPAAKPANAARKDKTSVSEDVTADSEVAQESAHGTVGGTRARRKDATNSPVP